MHVVRLYNPTQRDINAMYDGTPYLLPAKDVAYVPLTAAEHFVVYYANLGLRILREGESVPQDGESEESNEGDNNEEGSTTNVACHICGKDFSDRDRPTVALRRHLRLAHNVQTEVNGGDSTTTDI